MEVDEAAMVGTGGGAMRRRIVGVMGSGTEEWKELAHPLGRWLALQNVHLLTGGGNGVMNAVAQAFHSVPNRKGLVIGIIPGSLEPTGYQTPPGYRKCGQCLMQIRYPNPWIEIPIMTHLPLRAEQGQSPMSRNHINVLSSDVIVALPGNSGTSSEVLLARAYEKPVIAFLGPDGSIPDLPGEVPIARTLQQVEKFVLEHLHGSGNWHTTPAAVEDVTSPNKRKHPEQVGEEEDFGRKRREAADLREKRIAAKRYFEQLAAVPQDDKRRRLWSAQDVQMLRELLKDGRPANEEAWEEISAKLNRTSKAVKHKVRELGMIHCLEEGEGG